MQFSSSFFGIFVKRLDFLTVERHQHHDGNCKRSNLCNREGEPDIGNLTRQRQQIGCGQKNNHLTCDRGNHAVDTPAEGLEHAAEDDARPCKQEGQRQPLQCGNAHSEHLLVGIKEAQKHRLNYRAFYRKCNRQNRERRYIMEGIFGG